MDLEDLRTELAARGFDHLSDTRLNRYVNIGYSEATAQARFPFLAATATGTAPLTVTSLGVIESVESSDGRKLVPVDRRFLTDEYPGLSDTGTALYYYLAAANQVAVYPLDTTSSFTVRHWRRPTLLAADADVPLIPEEWQYVIVDYAAGRAYAENGDADQAAAARQEGDRTVAFMVDALIDAQVDGASSFERGSGSDW